MADDNKNDKKKPPKPLEKQLSSQDARLWASVTATTQPLKNNKRAHAHLPKTARKTPVQDKPNGVRATVGHSPSVQATQRKDLQAGRSDGVDKRLADRFRRGQLPIDATLDLHGMTQAQAHTALQNFIPASRRLGRRCLLVITGKGVGKSLDLYGRPLTGILREAAPHWLNGPGCREHVLSFTWAQPKHGGDGALYVLLKRNR